MSELHAIVLGLCASTFGLSLVIIGLCLETQRKLDRQTRYIDRLFQLANQGKPTPLKEETTDE